jgi:hypothetical protein
MDLTAVVDVAATAINVTITVVLNWSRRGLVLLLDYGFDFFNRSSNSGTSSRGSSGRNCSSCDTFGRSLHYACDTTTNDCITERVGLDWGVCFLDSLSFGLLCGRYTVLFVEVRACARGLCVGSRRVAAERNEHRSHDKVETHDFLLNGRFHRSAAWAGASCWDVKSLPDEYR